VSAPVDRDVREDVAELLVRYATGIDRRDWPLFRTCFTEDCHADYGDIGVWQGVEAITEYMRKVHAPMGHTLHRISNVAVTRSGDGVSARSYVDVVLLIGGDRGVHALGFYDDELVRTNQGWKIARRRFTMVHQSQLAGG
jgi:3-phenylpropionate/cinnamic acid dioxygenase small subunit